MIAGCWTSLSSADYDPIAVKFIDCRVAVVQRAGFALMARMVSWGADWFVAHEIEIAGTTAAASHEIGFEVKGRRAGEKLAETAARTVAGQ